MKLLMIGRKPTDALHEHLQRLPSKNGSGILSSKHHAHCVGWTCVPLAVDSYGRWGEEAHSTFHTIASRLSVRTRVSFSAALTSMYNTLGVVLARQNARAILARLDRVGSKAVGAYEVHQLASPRR